MPPMVFEPAISANERSQIYARDRATIGTGKIIDLSGMELYDPCFQQSQF